jgi:enediyne biosynthesis protein E4
VFACDTVPGRNIRSTSIRSLGLVTDALWTDFNNDGWQDLIVTGDWMPILFFKNQKGNLVQMEQTGIEWASGWWKSIAPSDLDNDGDLDYIVGNFGKNTFYKAQPVMPMTILAKDFDQNGSVDPFISFYVKDSLKVKRNYLYHPWEDVIKQFRALRKSFNSYSAYGQATASQIFENQNLTNALVKKNTWMESSWIENLGNDTFKLHALPDEVQWAPGYEDILMVGNDYGVEVNQGRIDAHQGIVLYNTQNKAFTAQNLETTHFIVAGDGKSLVQMNIQKEPYFIASQNNDSLKVFKPNFEKRPLMISWETGETNCLIYLGNHTVQKRTKQDSNTFQSQGTNQFWVSPETKKIEFFDAQQKRIRTQIIP